MNAAEEHRGKPTNMENYWQDPGSKVQQPIIFFYHFLLYIIFLSLGWRVQVTKEGIRWYAHHKPGRKIPFRHRLVFHIVNKSQNQMAPCRSSFCMQFDTPTSNRPGNVETLTSKKTSTVQTASGTGSALVPPWKKAWFGSRSPPMGPKQRCRFDMELHDGTLRQKGVEKSSSEVRLYNVVQFFERFEADFSWFFMVCLNLSQQKHDNETLKLANMYTPCNMQMKHNCPWELQRLFLKCGGTCKKRPPNRSLVGLLRFLQKLDVEILAPLGPAWHLNFLGIVRFRLVEGQYVLGHHIGWQQFPSLRGKIPGRNTNSLIFTFFQKEVFGTN